MTPFETIALLVTISAAFAYANHRWLRIPTSIGLMAMSMGVSVALLAADRLGLVEFAPVAQRLVEEFPFQEALLHGVLGALLFAGALHVDLSDLRNQLASVATMALAGTVLSTVLVGFVTHEALQLIGIPLSLLHCFLFGALISPTDPIAVLGILRKARVSRSLEIQITGESLFNDGIGVVIFLTVLGAASGERAVTASHVLLLFAREVLGGAAFGLATGYVAFRLIRSIDHYQTELLITLALVLGGYVTAERLGISAPIAAVGSGLLIGNHGRTLGMSEITRDHIDKFWALVDDLLNSLLFVIVGFEVIRLDMSPGLIVAGCATVGIVLAARFSSVFIAMAVLHRFVNFSRGALAILTWGGLRGGISVALALSLSATPERGTIVTMTYFVVTFAMLVQGLTLQRLAKHFATSPALSPAKS